MTKKLTVRFTAILITLLFSTAVHAQNCPGGAGCLDPTFGNGGKLTIPFPPSPGAGPLDIAILPDGKILQLVYGNRLVRLNADGTQDQTFGPGGLVTFPWPGASLGLANALTMRLQDVGGQQRIVLAGNTRIPSGQSFVSMLQMGRLLLDGSVDTSFGTNGTVLINTSVRSQQMELQADGKIVMLDSDGKVVRTSANGSLDTGFGSGGMISTGYARDVAIDSNGGILVGGQFTTGKGKNTKAFMGVKRYTPSGTLDTGFGIGGTVTIDFSSKDVLLAELAIDPLGNIVVAGGVAAPQYGHYYFSAARFTSNGIADTSFGGTGKVKFVGASGRWARGVLIQPDGKVVLTGSLNGDYALVRYNFDGTLDTTFGNAGSVIVDVDLDDNVDSWTFQTDPACACSKIVMASYGSGGSDLSFARFTVQ